MADEKRKIVQPDWLREPALPAGRPDPETLKKYKAYLHLQDARGFCPGEARREISGKRLSSERINSLNLMILRALVKRPMVTEALGAVCGQYGKARENILTQLRVKGWIRSKQRNVDGAHSLWEITDEGRAALEGATNA